MTDILREKILKFDGRAPRYTSYPSAPHFYPLSDTVTPGSWITQSISPQSTISLYIHIPFCQKMCWYCGCHTKVTRQYAPVENYLNLLLREIDNLAAHIKKSNKSLAPLTLSHLHFGGGSPSFLRAQDFDKIMIRLRRHFHFVPGSEIAIEIDPRNLSEGRIASYARNGVNRVSLGVQDFNEMTLAAVNRAQPFDLSYQGVKLLRHYGINNINLDIMYGLPHQSPETMKDTLSKALLLHPDRIAYFGYAHVPWMKKHMRLINEAMLPGIEERYDIFQMGASFLKEAGLMMIGIDHFAKESDSLVIAMKNRKLRRNFQGYTTDTAPLMLGLGASSIGYTPQGFLQNHPDIPLYKEAVLAGKLPIKKICPITDDDRLRADIIENIMCYGMVDFNQICAAHSIATSYFNQEFDALQVYIEQGFITLAKGILCINPDALLLTRVICTKFDRYFQQSQAAAPRHAKVI